MPHCPFQSVYEKHRLQSGVIFMSAVWDDVSSSASADIDISERKPLFNFHGGVCRNPIVSYHVFLNLLLQLINLHALKHLY